MSGRRDELSALPLLLAVVAGAIYEVAVALQWVSLGTLPGEGPRYGGFFATAALVAILVGSIVSFALAMRDQSNRVIALLGTAAAAFMVARFYAFDPYNLPTLLRYSESGTFSPTWVYAVAILAVSTSLLCLLRPRIGFIVSVPALLLCAFTATLFGFGH